MRGRTSEGRGDGGTPATQRPRAPTPERAAPPRWPVEARFAYRVEHIDFEDTNDLRLAGLLGGIAVRFGR